MKTKVLISFTVTGIKLKLIWAFAFAYADCWFSDVTAQSKLLLLSNNISPKQVIYGWHFNIYEQENLKSQPN